MDFSNTKTKFKESEFKGRIKSCCIKELTDEEKKTIVSRAINDADPYKKTTLYKINTPDKQIKIFNLVSTICEKERTEEEFKDWYEETIVSLKKDIYELNSYKFGKIQKIVNMTLKYLYCFSDEETDNCFKFCHMPLDKYIYEDWYLNDVIHGLKLNIKKKDMPNCWSNIDNATTYFEIQDIISNYIKNDFSTKIKFELTPLQAEFYLWPYLKCRRAKKELEKQYGKYYSEIDNYLKNDLAIKEYGK